MIFPYTQGKIESQDVPVQKIGAALYSFRFCRDDRPLYTSIQNFGIINPPRLIPDGQEYRIIDGGARVEAAKKMGLTQITCQVHSVSEKNNAELFLLALELNCWNRTFNLMEKSLCLKIAQEVFAGIKIPKRFWEVVGIREDIRTIYQHKELLKLPLSVQKYAVNNDIPLTVILGFLRFPPTQIEAIANQLFLLPINRNKLAEILTLLYEVSKRERLMPLDVLNALLMMLDGETNLFQKEQKLRDLLNQKRNPAYSKRLAFFEKNVRALNLPVGTQVEPALFFEEEAVTLHSKINSLKDRDQLVEMLKGEGWLSLLRGG